MADLTEWYPADVKPVREGWYECQSCGNGTRHYWTGEAWANDAPDTSRFIFASSPFIVWRGLAKEPA